MSHKQVVTAIALILTVSTSFWAQEPSSGPQKTLTYCVVGTGQTHIFSDRGQLLKVPKPGEPFFGQDAFYQGPKPSYRDNGDGTVSDLNTGLMWVQARGSKVPWSVAVAGAPNCRVGRYADWRMPTIKELYSLINFNGGFHPEGNSTPYLDTKYFRFVYGDQSKGERPIDCQDWSATEYVGTTMDGNPTVFGVNFADGRIKGYPKQRRGPDGVTTHKLYVRYVRGNPNYGKNDFHDNGDGTITDRATGLMWSKADSRMGMNWEAALAWVQAKNAEKYLGHSDWRLPNAKELQSIVDYTRAPAVTHSPAIAPIFQTTRLSNGEYPYFWSSTTHLDGPSDRQGTAAVYVAFGRALGWMQFPPGRGEYRLLDVHGAGAQRSDPEERRSRRLSARAWAAGRRHLHQQLRPGSTEHRPGGGAACPAGCHAAACCHGQTAGTARRTGDGAATRLGLSAGNGARARYETAAPSTT